MGANKKTIIALIALAVVAAIGAYFAYGKYAGKDRSAIKEKAYGSKKEKKAALNDSSSKQEQPAQLFDENVPRQSIQPGEKAPDKSLVIMGWDGAGWRNVKTLLEQGRLPNLKNLIEKTGMDPFPLDLHGKTNTANVWTQVWTGLDPDQSGVSGNGYFYSNNNGCPQYEYNRKENIFNYGYWIRPVPYMHTIAAPLQRRGVSLGWFVSKGANTGGKERSPLGAFARYADELLFIKPAKDEQFNDYTKALGDEFEGEYNLKEKGSVDKIKGAAKGANLAEQERKTLDRKIEKYSSGQYTDDYIYYLADAAKQFIAERKNNFAVFVLANPDYYGHVHGENGQRYLDEFVRADKVLGEILSVIPKDTKILIIADHGFDEDTIDHLNATDAWGWTNLPIYKGYRFQKNAAQRAFAAPRDIAVTVMEYFGVDWKKEIPERRGRSLID